MYELEISRLKEYQERLQELRKCLNVEGARTQIVSIEHQMAAAGFWDDPDTAQKALQKLKTLKASISAPDDLHKELEDALAFAELAREEADESLAPEILSHTNMIEERLKLLELNSLFTDPRDAKNVILSIHPGAGGTESCDWAEMLFRMIMRFCERREYVTEVVDYLPGEEAGLKSATITIAGPFAYGNLRSEAGVHRLVRISPFDAAKRRHTSFVAIEVLTEVDENIEIEIREEDLKMDVFRSSGAGGQKVNKTSSAVRLTHLPTGIVVACQIERSQHRNRATALQFLKAKLYDRELKRQESELAAQRDGQQDVAWGSQIRSYVLHPYQMIKDHRTGVETSNVDRVLDGDLDMFIEGYLKWDLHRKSRPGKTGD
ncbi:MAG TPA: peptide chain release factor 2 [Candidatus Hydrogenedentes bacterium]|nr:peptide chain release factor 2 [Candidatus Hydrogenedentota bacterium]HOV75218.1 peptide chain release factor 2 [Candidatus Hydrogenedentota bacterium]HPC17586.1 peptide chain release factor 2 [Candidatus Hydrogenedentota bacterium]HRT21471.1 peptide chain release factor 2 [Candidatus Hydrogenedentota bacterium]HRT63925.1 peptide chain release factor 2 [Candidatus Hydrogenedentota bacterium]